MSWALSLRELGFVPKGLQALEASHSYRCWCCLDRSSSSVPCLNFPSHPFCKTRGNFFIPLEGRRITFPKQIRRGIIARLTPCWSNKQVMQSLVGCCVVGRKKGEGDLLGKMEMAGKQRSRG